MRRAFDEYTELRRTREWGGGHKLLFRKESTMV
jgi:hypothetical protein